MRKAWRPFARQGKPDVRRARFVDCGHTVKFKGDTFRKRMRVPPTVWLSTLVLLRKQLRREKFREQREYVQSSGFVDFTQAFDQSALVQGPNSI